MWSQSYPYAWYCSPAVADNGGIYIIDGTGTLRRIDATTGSTLSSSSGWGGGYGTRPAIGKDGLIYANTEASFSVFNPDCSLKWSFYGFYDSYWCAPAIGLDGTVYSTRRNNGFCAWHD
jgi:outer membrane protein assembly factor BamB